MDSEQIVTDVAERLRALISDAEERAAAIVREAEEEATRIRARAEAEGQERLAEVRRALSELEGRLGAAGLTPAQRPGAEVEPGPVIVPEPTPDPVPEPGPAPIPEPTPDPTPEPTPEPIPEPVPPPDEGTPPSPTPDPEAAAPSNGTGGAGPRSADAAAARLVAMNMALGGSSREEIDAALAAGYDLPDREALVRDVLARAGR